MRFYGREEELQALRNQALNASEHRTARLAVVTGRRRVGKTALIEQAFGGGEIPYAYCFVSESLDEKDFCRLLVESVARSLKISYWPTLERIDAAFDYLFQLSRTTPYVLAVDECQEAEARVPNFWAKLQKAWDLGKAGSQLVLVISGSVQTTLERAFGEQNAPLFGRADLFLVLPPFTTQEVQDIFYTEYSEGTNADLLLLYAATGGVARYIEFFANQGALRRDKLLTAAFSGGSWFQLEGQIAAGNEFRNKSPIYMQILLLIAAGVTKRNELQDRFTTDISPYLQRLEKEYRLIERVEPVLQNKTMKNVRFGIRDPFLKFWYTFVEREDPRTLIERGHYAALREYVEAELPGYLGRTLEQWFLGRYKENPTWIRVGRWWDRRGENEIDVVAIDRTGRRIEFAEVKLNPDKYDEFALRQKVAAFLSVHPEFREFKLSLRGLSVSNMLETL